MGNLSVSKAVLGSRIPSPPVSQSMVGTLEKAKKNLDNTKKKLQTYLKFTNTPTVSRSVSNSRWHKCIYWYVVMRLHNKLEPVFLHTLNTMTIPTSHTVLHLPTFSWHPQGWLRVGVCQTKCGHNLVQCLNKSGLPTGYNFLTITLTW